MTFVKPFSFLMRMKKYKSLKLYKTGVFSLVVGGGGEEDEKY